MSIVSTPAQPDPHAEYEARLKRWKAAHAAEAARFDRIAYLRLATGIGAVLLGILAWRQVLSPWAILVPVAVFVGLVLWHDRVARRQQLASRAIAFYDNGLARLEDRWVGTGNPGERFHDTSHVYSEDLDLFGKGSLFELLCAARTSAGEETLAAWLKSDASSDGKTSAATLERGRPARPGAAGVSPAGSSLDQVISEVLARQEAVAELRARLDLREDLALLGEDVRQAVHPELLTGWAAGPPVVFPSWAHSTTIVLAVLAVLALAAYAFDWLSLWALGLVAVLELVVTGVLRRRVEAVIYAVEKPAHELETLSLVIERLERESFSSERLAALRKELETAGEASHSVVPASRLIRRLHILVDHREWNENLFFRLAGFLLMWDPRYAMQIEHWRREQGPNVGRWMAVIGQMEALSSLAGFAYEHPTYPFPEFDAGARFAAKGLRHPLMAAAKCVPNDVRLGGDEGPTAQLLIVSGSNMSGKSTLLRACGLNTVLAHCGAPVAAEQLRLSPLAVGASIRVLDSLLDNRSRFFAEITRLRQILDLTAGPLPALFLLDEILGGTNSHDRRIGAEALLRRLLERCAIGLITTHDLTLAEIADSLAETARTCTANGSRPADNVHFEDQLVDGQIRFDYRLRPGVVTRSNALALMRNLGLIE